jgi:hypothetical protein
MFLRQRSANELWISTAQYAAGIFLGEERNNAGAGAGSEKGPMADPAEVRQKNAVG